MNKNGFRFNQNLVGLVNILFAVLWFLYLLILPLVHSNDAAYGVPIFLISIAFFTFWIICELPLLLLGLFIIFSKKLVTKSLAVIAITIQLIILLIIFIPGLGNNIYLENSKNIISTWRTDESKVSLLGLITGRWSSPSFSIITNNSYSVFNFDKPLNKSQGKIDLTIKDYSDSGSQLKFDVWIDDMLIKTLSEKPYTFQLDITNLSRGQHILKVKGVDDVGNIVIEQISFVLN